jgi:hypothetical protein
MILTELINKRQDVKFSDIPLEWVDSFNKFMYGQTCYKDTDTNEFMAYYTDYARWYYANKSIILREEKIDQIKS